MSLYQFRVLLAAVSLFGLQSSCSHQPVSERLPQTELRQSYEFMAMESLLGLKEKQRVGLFLESPESQFQGCVIYLQGLGDSIRNHAPLFHALNRAGLRVLSFDYLGQGGSEGHMNSTRVMLFHSHEDHQAYEIGAQAKKVWEHFSQTPDPIYKRSCKDQPHRVLGWSTGGLAGYRLAAQGWAHQVVLLAPGIAPKACVGEAAKSCLRIFTKGVITMPTLTRDQFPPNQDPHWDPIHPTSPSQALLFATNLLETSMVSHAWKISPKVRGLVLLSGDEDSYVDAKATREILKLKAPHFLQHAYAGALHELDNEIPEVATDVRQRSIDFFLAP